MIGTWTPLFRVTCGVPAEVVIIKLSLLRGVGARAVALLVGDRLQPFGFRGAVAAALPQGQVLHEPVRGGAVPVLLAGRAGDRLAGVGFDDGDVAGGDQRDAGHDVQGLAQDVGVRPRAGICPRTASATTTPAPASQRAPKRNKIMDTYAGLRKRRDSNPRYLSVRSLSRRVH